GGRHPLPEPGGGTLTGVPAARPGGWRWRWRRFHGSALSPVTATPGPLPAGHVLPGRGGPGALMVQT
ncbi:MAG: hypothetical protein WKF80_05825, partial [Thermomicrobiales bacterium]